MPATAFAASPVVSTAVDRAARRYRKNSRAVSAIRREIRSRWPYIVKASGIGNRQRKAIANALPVVPKLLGSSTKTDKGEGQGILSAVVYMSPATESGVNLCPFATAGCAAACLGHSAGRMSFGPMRIARLWKTALLLGAPDLFGELLRSEVQAHAARAHRLGMLPAVRVDGSTDTGLGQRIASASPGVAFWDYTKDATRIGKRRARNYSLTFSASGQNGPDVKRALASGMGVAVVVSARPKIGTSPAHPIPGSLFGFPTVDGDRTDARWTDRETIPTGGYIVALRFKASKGREKALQKAARQGFAVAV